MMSKLVSGRLDGRSLGSGVDLLTIKLHAGPDDSRQDQGRNEHVQNLLAPSALASLVGGYGFGHAYVSL